jgi:hypothetical protein
MFIFSDFVSLVMLINYVSASWAEGVTHDHVQAYSALCAVARNEQMYIIDWLDSIMKLRVMIIARTLDILIQSTNLFSLAI